MSLVSSSSLQGHLNRSLQDEDGPKGWGLFTQNLILAAHAVGVEGCLQASVMDYASQIKKCRIP
ncbi:MAG: hypothetical protein M0009_05795, partial [Deltaproteobacteria bacterium]|nr:hypothetical protein [Deltaproteobacteria bacterium]